MKTAALIVAAGQGVRAGGAVPKQYAKLAGKPMLAHSYAALSHHPGVDEVIVVIAVGQENALKEALGEVAFAYGGATRRQSVANGLAATQADRVLVHDAARPFLSSDVIDRLLTALEEDVGAIPGLPVADTLVREDGAPVSRDGLVRVQTPQAFHTGVLRAAHAAWSEDAEATDDAQMVRALGHEVRIVEGAAMLEKVTLNADFAAAEARYAASMRVRSAQGYDVHRFAEGEELWLGGIQIPHSHGLSGHSDADVALHAITDALLGTIGAGDIGMHFPPSDPKWRGAASAKFLEHAAGLVAAEGGIIDYVDLTLICEAPKIGPHREAIRASIAAILKLPVSRISLKATTTERLGFTGRSEGMAAQAIATIRIADTI